MSLTTMLRHNSRGRYLYGRFMNRPDQGSFCLAILETTDLEPRTLVDDVGFVELDIRLGEVKHELH